MFAGRRKRQELLLRLPLRRADLFSDRVFSDTEPPCNLSIAQAFSLEPRDDTQPSARNATAAGTPTGTCSQRRHPAVRVALLVSPYGALGTPECYGNLFLRGVAAVTQQHHGIGFGHTIFLAVVVHGESSHDNHSLFTFRAQ